jgi:hypothetical protein
MRSLWLQVAAVTAINLKSIAQRRWLSLSTVIAIALVVIVLLAFLAMANGFQRTIAGSGADDIAIVLRAGSQAEINSTVSRDQVRLIEDGPGIARGSDGKPLISPELYLVVDGIKRSTKTKANLPLRGIGEQQHAAQGHRHHLGPHVQPRQQRSGGRQGIAAPVRRLRPWLYRGVRRHALDRRRRVRRGRQRVRIRNLGRSQRGAEPVQPQQRRPDRARARHRAGRAE